MCVKLYSEYIEWQDSENNEFSSWWYRDTISESPLRIELYLMKSAEFHDCLVIYHALVVDTQLTLDAAEIVFHWPNNDDFFIVSPE